VSFHACLFTAPSDFLGPLRETFQKTVPTRFQEIWHREELSRDEQVRAWIVNPGQHFVVNEGVLDLFPKLELLVTPSTGCNHIDMQACRNRNIPVYSLLDDRPGLNQIAASAEFTFLLLLNTLRRLDVGIQEVTQGRWRSREDLLRGRELQGRSVGLVGLGRIGRRVARYCQAFDAQVLYSDPYVTDPKFPARELEALFSQVDIVCVCCRLTSETTRMITGSLLRRLKPNACLINTSRGEVIVEEELAEVLQERTDLKVGLDVLSGEVTNQHLSSPLITFHQRGQIVITPHAAGVTVESQTRAAQIALGLLQRHLKERKEVLL